MSDTITLTLKVWRQRSADDAGHFEIYKAKDINVNMSFLEMLDVVNDTLTLNNQMPIAFDHDCREGICGSCGAMVNGVAHGPVSAVTLCQLHMRSFSDGDTIVIEPFRAKSLPIIQDLVIDRTAFDRIIAKGGYISVKTGSAPEANDTPIKKTNSDSAFDAAACIGCSACVAACPNASASLFVAAKVSHLALLPQGSTERKRVLNMVDQMDAEGFGGCSNAYQCEAACPKQIKVENIARMNREYTKQKLSR
ncbi:MAG: succinate dehydrogenase/fumarate reductase iron-sulfur subunit [Candidatus Margulisbacteria bacterium]|nr:succinate dehydrogenase/fumarate reductase iron-sulfur subunit [Candidatus Margulisiibacteriota bacterium]